MSDQNKEAILARAEEIGVHKAAKEAGVAWQTVAKWKREGDQSASVTKKKRRETKMKTAAVADIEGQILEVEKEIATLEETLKEKKASLKDLKKAKAAEEKAAAKRRAEEQKAELIAALEKSEKSVEEILEFLR